MHQVKDRDFVGILIITLLFPFVGLLLSLYYWRQSWAKNIFWIFCAYLGAVMIFQAEGTILGVGADASKCARELQYLYTQKLDFSYISSTLFKDGKTVDVFYPVLMMLVSRFTDNGHVLFFILALIVGFFFSRNIWCLLDKLPNKIGKWTWVLIGLYILTWPISTIGGVRFVLATHVFVYGALPYLLENNKKKLFWCFLTVFIHFSFLFPILVLLLYILLPKKSITPFFIIYVITLFINTINITSLGEALSGLLPSVYEGRVEGYTNAEIADNYFQAVGGAAGHIKLSKLIMNWSMVIYIFLSYFSVKKYFEDNKAIVRLFEFALLLYGISNIFALVPSGGRFVGVSRLFMIPLIVLVVCNSGKKSQINLFHSILSFLLAYVLVIYIWKEMGSFGWTAIFGNFITVFFFETNVPLMALIKSILS